MQPAFLVDVEVLPGIEPGNKGFADLGLTAWLERGSAPSLPLHRTYRSGIRRYIVVWCQALLPVASQSACKANEESISASPAAPGYDPFALAFAACSGNH